MLLQPSEKTTPDRWAIDNRIYPPSAGVPGPRDPRLTPYIIEPGRVVASRSHRKVVFACGSQMGKSDLILDLIGHHFDQHPSPFLYVGPTGQFLTEQWEPRITDLFAQAKSLRDKLPRGLRMTKTRKVIAGQPLRLAHAGSSTALKSDPFRTACTDEADELMASIKGQGDPITLVDARGQTYADFVHFVCSTPSAGPKEAVVDEDSGLAFWGVQDPADISSKIWTLWQEGTRHHWAWRCPGCGEFFVPRFDCLEISRVEITGPDGRATTRQPTPSEARASAHLVCPHNGCVITEADKVAMNAAGVYVAPGQRIGPDGEVTGDPPEAPTVSFWVSGLASPFVSFGERAEAYVKAVQSGDPEEIRAVMNAGFGELWAPMGGDVPEWEEVRGLSLPYHEGDVPAGVLALTCGVDVQKNRLVYVIRGWGVRQESWLITRGEIWGATEETEVWTDLADLLESRFAGLHIARTFVDAGFRPGKKEAVPEHRVYEFARRHSRTVYATKGFDTRPTPLSVNRIDVNAKGGKAKYGLDLVRLSADFFKSWVHERLRWPDDQPGGWHLFDGIDEDYCRQIVSEARVKKPTGNGFQWVKRYRDNHFLDAEALAYAAAYMLGIQRVRDTAERPVTPRQPAPQTEESAAPVTAPRQPRPSPQRRGGWLSGEGPRGGGWLGGR